MARQAKKSDVSDNYKSKIMSEMSAFADWGLLPDITFATNIFKNAPIHSGNLLQDAFSIHMSNNICGKRTSPRGKEKNAQFHIVHQLPI